jgi:hypothetical protein
VTEEKRDAYLLLSKELTILEKNVNPAVLKFDTVVSFLDGVASLEVQRSAKTSVYRHVN